MAEMSGGISSYPEGYDPAVAPAVQPDSGPVIARLLFSCTEKTVRKGYGTTAEPLGGVKLGPIYPHHVSDDDSLKAEISAFYAYTPAGAIEFSTINEVALAQFEPGEAYEVVILRRTG